MLSRTTVFSFVFFVMFASFALSQNIFNKWKYADEANSHIAKNQSPDERAVQSFRSSGQKMAKGPFDLSKMRIRVPGLSPNQPPTAPYIAGYKVCNRGSREEYDYSSVDPDGDMVQYQIEFNGNGNYKVARIVPLRDGVGGYMNSGTITDFFYSWEDTGVKMIRIRASDTMGEFSEWSTFEILVQ